MRTALLLSVLVIAATAAAPASSEPEAVGGSGSLAAVSGSDRASGSLSLNAALLLRSTSVPGCPLGPTADQCVTRTTSGAIHGLGQVEATYSHYLGLGPPACAPEFGKTLAYPIRLTVASKGELELAVAEGTCQAAVAVPNQARTFTITGGVGIYAGASGSGTLQPQVAQEVCDASSCHRDGYENWTGTLTVPGVEFDLTPPALSGATAKTVRVPKSAKTARVTFKVTATDDVDGAVPAVCQPRSGTKFKVGRTTVRCEATDSSGNTGKAAFAVTVKRRLTLAARAVSSSTGTLALSAVLQVESLRFVECPPNTPVTIECTARSGRGTMPGLGEVSVVPYMYFIDLVPAACPAGETRVLTSSMVLVVAGKGEIDVITAPTGCLQGSEGRPNTVQSFSITGGTGMYAGATGGGQLSRAFTVTDVGAVGPETWTGTLVVPGLEFDLTPPTLSGAASKTVRVPRKAKSARVTFAVTATDDVDGAVPVSCQPRSGSKFKAGKTTVRCEATDSSGNTAKAAFTVTVKLRR